MSSLKLYFVIGFLSDGNCRPFRQRNRLQDNFNCLSIYIFEFFFLICLAKYEWIPSHCQSSTDIIVAYLSRLQIYTHKISPRRLSCGDLCHLHKIRKQFSLSCHWPKNVHDHSVISESPNTGLDCPAIRTFFLFLADLQDFFPKIFLDGQSHRFRCF